MRMLLIAALVAFSTPALADSDYWVYNSSPCMFWEQRVNRTTPTDDWRRAALYLCLDFYRHEDRGQKIPDNLIAAKTALDDFIKLFNQRQKTFFETTQLFHDQGISLRGNPELAKLDLSPKNIDKLADTSGLLLVIEAVENGY